MTDRIATFRAMVERAPDNALARFGLANELLKASAWAEAAEQLERYLAVYPDEGNGWGRYADALRELGRVDEARAAFEQGIAAAGRFGHSGLANELEARRDELDEA
ncbi:MAG: tetratricopeptide repeat protein [Gemmatimonadaceae bacterium]|jgi:predicted Zn-dependent protease|nr:tetratricopeptide repeat protein [Gemmatimonadaceae bacterium]